MRAVVDENVLESQNKPVTIAGYAKVHFHQASCIGLESQGVRHHIKDFRTMRARYDPGEGKNS